jgi:hypothetical protein
VAHISAATGTEWLADQPRFNALGVKKMLRVTGQLNHLTLIQNIRTNDALPVNLLILNAIGFVLCLKFVLELLQSL